MLDGFERSISWVTSLLVHMTLLLLAALAWSPPPKQGAVAEPDRAGGIVLVDLSSETPKYVEPVSGDAADSGDSLEANSTAAAPGERTADSGAAGGIASALPGPESAPVDATSLLPGAKTLVGDAATPGGAGGPGLPAATGLLGQNGGGGGASGRSAASGLGKPANTYVFGVQGTGSKFFYVFDRSASMSGYEGRPLAAAKRELAKSLRSLESTHQFQIVFYNHRTTVFNPHFPQAPRMIFGEDKNKQLAENFIRGISADGGTDHMQALRMALGLAPDVIFFLTDADDPQLTADELNRIARLNRGTVINAIEFGVGPPAGRANFLVRLAQQNGGQHAYVDVTRLPAAGQ